MKRGFLFSIYFILFFQHSLSQGIPDYYSSDIDFSLTGDDLRNDLQDLISDYTGFSYSSVWNILKESDLYSGDDVLLIYGYNNNNDGSNTDRLRDKDLTANSAPYAGKWNREHVFPKSLASDSNGDFETMSTSIGIGTDLHNLRPADQGWNSTRGNKKFEDSSGSSSGAITTGWYPGDEHKGDVARIIMYMYTMYANESLESLPNNVGLGGNTHHADMPDIFLEWNADDPVDTFEEERNETIYSYQGNRNPFIDNPFLAYLIWGGPVISDAWGITLDPMITFESSSSVSETNGTISTYIDVTMSNYSNQVTLTVSDAQSGTAEPSDYNLVTSELEFNGNGTLQIEVEINDDSDNNDETVVLSVSVASNSVSSANLVNTQHTISISDDESQIIITEIADPDNNNNNNGLIYNFIEIFNSSNSSIDLSEFYLLRWTNGNSEPQSSPVPTSLSSKCGSSLGAKSFCIVSYESPQDFASIYGFYSDGDGSNGGPVGSNGDDNIAIVKIADNVTYDSTDENTYTVIDMFGVAGEDGSGTAHEFEDGRAERKASSSTPSAVWVASDWNIDNDSSGQYAGDGVQEAPEDFDPGYWIGEDSVKTWSGLSSSDWSSVSNWASDNSAPDADDIVYIRNAIRNPEISANEEIEDLVLKSGAELDVLFDGSIIVNGDFTNSGVVTLNSQSDQFSSIVVDGTSTGEIVYKRFVADEGADEWDLIGSPVEGLSIDDFVSSNASLANHNNQYGIGVFSNDGNIDTAAAMYTNYTTSSVGDAGDFVSGQGYSMATDENVSPGTSLDFTGSVLTTDVSEIGIDDNSLNAPILGKWNLVANPFPSYINANTNANPDANFLSENEDNLHPAYAYVYGYNESGSFDVYNQFNSPVYIAPGQGFFVASDDSSGNTITFTKEMRTVNGSDDFIAGDLEENIEVVLRLLHGTEEIEETKVYFKSGLSLGLDIGYDAGNFNQNAAIMSRLPENDEGHGMIINAVDVNHIIEGCVIALVINQSAGQEFKVNLHTSTIYESNIYLEDAEEGTMTDLKAGDFTLNPVGNLEGAGRFFLHITSNTMSSENVSTSMLNAYKQVNANYITIEGLATQSNNINVSLYNILGTKVLDTSLSNNVNTQTLSAVGMASGIYIIELESGNDRLTKKLIIQ